MIGAGIHEPTSRRHGGSIPEHDRYGPAVRTLRWVALIGVALLFLWITIRIDLVIFGGVLLAVFLRRLSLLVGRFLGLSDGWALASTVTGIALALGGLGYFFFNSIYGQVEELSRRLPPAISATEQLLQNSPIGSSLLDKISPERLMQSAGGAPLSGIFGVAGSLVEIGAGIFVIFFIGLYVAAETDLYCAGLLRLVPPHHRSRAAAILGAAGDALWYWLLGRLSAMVVLGALTTLGLWLIGIPVPAALGLLAALLIFVPYLGAVASAVPSVLLALTVGPIYVAYVVALYILIHIAEGYLLVPLIQRRAVHLPPALGLANQVVWALLAGMVGLLFATPLLAAGMVLVRMIYIEDILGDGDNADAYHPS